MFHSSKNLQDNDILKSEQLTVGTYDQESI